MTKQVTGYLLCSECEERFSAHGEDWMMRQVWNGKRFPLLDWLNVAVEKRRSADALIYSGTTVGIDTDKLAYFALSVF